MSPQTHPISRRGFRTGVLAALPVMLATAPFGMIFGVIAVEAGLDITQTLAMSALVLAGASQLAALQLLSDGAPVLLAVLAGAVVNLRMAMYSAALALHWEGAPLWTRALAAVTLHDQSFALSVTRYQRRPEEPLADRLGFYFGVGLITSCMWIATTLAGASLGEALPASVDLGAIIPVTFVAIAAPMLRGKVLALVAAVAAGAGLLAAGLPFGMGLLIASAAGIAAGMALSTPPRRPSGRDLGREGPP